MSALQVRSAFEAVALKGVFETLLKEGVVIVVTSNRAPTELNQQGLQEDLFLHFVASLLDTCDVVPLDTGVDYRRSMWQLHTEAAAQDSAKTQVHGPDNSIGQGISAADDGQREGSHGMPPQPAATYLQPCSAESIAAFDAAWQRCIASCGCKGDQPRTIPVMYDRQLAVSRAAGTCARVQFDDLCGTPKGAADYMSLATHFDTVFIEGVPTMSMQVRPHVLCLICADGSCVVA